MKRKDIYKIMVVVFGILFVVWGLAQYSAYHAETTTSGGGGYYGLFFLGGMQGATPGSICIVHVKADNDVDVQVISTADLRMETKEVTHTSTSTSYGYNSTTHQYELTTNEYTYTTNETKPVPVAEKTGRDVSLVTITGKTTMFMVNVENPDKNDGSIKYTLDMIVWAPNYLLILIGIVFISSVFIYSWIKSEPVIPKTKKYYPAHKIGKKIEIPVAKTLQISHLKLKDKQDLIR